MKTLATLILIFGFLIYTSAQTKVEESPSTPVWTEADKRYLLDNLSRSKEEIIAETKNLTKDQWNFKESPDRWSINQIVEHICIWELIHLNEISVSLRMGPLPDFTHYLSDSNFLQNPNAVAQNNAMDYTKPFSYAIPLGNNEGKNNIIWLTTMRDESIDYLKKETKNIRLYYINFGPNIHQNFMMNFGHTDRHLRQIKKVKAHPKYPK